MYESGNQIREHGGGIGGNNDAGDDHFAPITQNDIWAIPDKQIRYMQPPPPKL